MIHEFEDRQFSANAPLFDGLWQGLPAAEKPTELWIRGKPEAFALLERLPAQGFAVVGTRAPQLRSTAFLRQELARIRNLDLILISGLARGIDTAAHRAAIELGIPTLAILGSGLNRIYPRENLPLSQAIVDSGGLLITEWPEMTGARGYHFIQRNRLIAALSRALWVVEAPARSGSLNTARWARNYDRTVFATPSFPVDPPFLGTRTLIEQHEAHPFWSALELGLCWREIPSRLTEEARSAARSIGTRDESSEERALVLEIAQRTGAHGGAEILALLEWALERGWTAGRFHEALDAALETGEVRESQGVLLKNLPFRV
jgi:DNA protecting protein DprA